MTPQGAARRRLAKAGLGAAGILWTTQASASRVCMSASAALSSGLQSKTPDATLACNGQSPDVWKTQGGWPVPSDTLFSAVFHCSERNDGTYGSATLLQMVQGATFDENELGRYLVTAYLNVKMGYIGFLSERTLLQMWSQLQSTGHYEPAKGVFWDARQTRDYLQSTV